VSEKVPRRHSVFALKNLLAGPREMRQTYQNAGAA
jgi:hypothetical protein